MPKRCLVVIAGALALLLIAGGWAGSRAISARDHLRAAQALVLQLRQELLTVDPAATSTLDRLRTETRAARSDLSGPVWRLSGHLPKAGDDLTAVRAVTAALDDLTRDGFPQLVAAAGLLRGGSDPLRDPIALRRAAPGLDRAERAFRSALATVDAVAGRGLTSVDRLRDQLARAVALLSGAARAATLLPAMLGADEPRTYLVLFQNLAEVRATGGMPGAFVAIRADRGRVEIAGQGTATGLRPFDRPVLPLDPADRQLWTDKLATYPADINLTPHFPTTARLAREMYRRRTGVTVDGVLSTDPVALSYLLRALGPVPVPGGATLTADTAVRTLLSRIYTTADQDAYFAAAARAVFRAVLGRPLDPGRLRAALTRAAGERRLLVWSAREPENLLLAGTTLAGALPERDPAAPTVGVFLNDGSGAKLGYYLTHAADLAVTPGCRSDRRRELTLRVRLGSTAPRAGLPSYVLGLGLSGDPYTVRTNVSVYSPAGGAIAGMRLDGVRQQFGSGRDRRRAVGIVTVDVPPGQGRTLDVTLLTGVPATGFGAEVTPRLWLTPGITPWPQSIESAPGCPAGR